MNFIAKGNYVEIEGKRRGMGGMPPPPPLSYLVVIYLTFSSAPGCCDIGPPPVTLRFIMCRAYNKFNKDLQMRTMLQA